MNRDRELLLKRIDDDKDRLVRAFQDFTRIDTMNPPGDTRAGAAFLSRLLDDHGVPYKVIAPQETMPNILASVAMNTLGRHLVLNGHIDVFPAGDREAWSRDPLCGDIVDGRVFGRGTADMKCGTTASIFTFLYLHQLRDRLKGRLTLTLVSDEETGGLWGTGYLIEKHSPEVLGDCVLNGEPSSPWTVRFGEKSPLWITFRIRTPGAHGAYPHVSKSATKIAARLMLDLETLEELRPNVPEAVARVMARPEVRSAIDRGLGKGASDVMERVTVNFGTVRGGVKVNMLPGECIVEGDIRLPVGVDQDEVRAAVARILERYPEVSAEEGKHRTFNANWSPPEHEMLRLIQDNAEALGGTRPAATLTLGGTDCRYWREKGVPAYVYGCTPGRMGAPDESVLVSEFLHIVKTHALCAFDYLSRG